MVSIEKSIVWPQEAIYTLLEKIRDREVLWNIRHKDYPKKNLRRALFDEVGKELKLEFPSLEHLAADDVLAKFAYIRGHFQKQLRKIEKMPSGSGGKITPKWEYFQACSFMMPIYSNLATISSFQLAPEAAEIVYQGSLEDLLEEDAPGIGTSMELSTPSPSTTSLQPPPSPTPTPTSSAGTSEPRSDTENLRSEGKATPHSSKKRRLFKKQDPVRETLLDTLHSVQNKVRKQDEFITTCVRSFMEYTPNSSSTDKERVAKLKDRFTEKVLQLITQTMKEINSETTESD